MNLADLFTVASLTDAINRLPAAPSQIGRMGLFAPRGIRTTSVVVDLRDGVITLIPSTPRGSAGAQVQTPSRSAVTLPSAHLVASGVILPEDVQDVREFGKEGIDAGLASQATVINDRLADLKADVEATIEYHRAGALSGVVLDASGAVLTNLFTAFGVTPTARSIAFGSATTEVLTEILAAKRIAEKKLGGIAPPPFGALCSPAFFDALVTHPSVKAAYANYQAASDRLGGDMRTGFVHGGVEWVEYADAVGSVQFIADGKARLFPKVRELYKDYRAPADYNEAVNTIGKEYYAKSEERAMNKGWDLEAQSNPIVFCTRPEALIELSVA